MHNNGVAFSLNATIVLASVSKSSICLFQLVDFLDVTDDPILGYTAPAIITVLHTHLATCAVDYR